MAAVDMPRDAAHVPVVDILLRRYHQLKRKYERRNIVYLHLLRLYENDPRAHGMRGDTDSPEIILNRFFDKVNTFVDFKGIPPNIHFYPPTLEPDGKQYADTMEKYLYALWDVNKMDNMWPRVTFDQSLLGAGNMGVLPTRELDGFLQFRRFTPSNFYPQCYAGTNELKYYFYEEKVPKEELKEKWPGVDFNELGRNAAWLAIWPEGSLDPDYSIEIEYCDENWLVYMVADKIVFAIKHGFGFCPGVIFENIVKPDLVGGMSDVAMYESLQIYESALMTMVADILDYWTDPMLFITSDSLSAGDVNLGGITIGRKGDTAGFVEPNIRLEAVDAQMKRVAQAFHDGTIPETLYGRVETKGALGSAPVLTGLQVKFMVRLNALYRRNGRALVDLFTMALKIAKKLYHKKRITYTGWRKNRYFHLDMYGSQIQEYMRHRVFWDMSVTDPDRHLVMEMQKVGQRLQSIYRTMENLGLCAGDELELIRHEDIYEIKKKVAEQLETQRVQTELMGPTVEETNRNILAGVKGGKVYPTAEGQQRPGPGRPRAATAPAGERALAAPAIDAERVVADLSAVKKLKGDVYLVNVAETVDIALSDKKDKQTILNAPTMQVYKGRIVFITMQKGQAREGWTPIRTAGGK